MEATIKDYVKNIFKSNTYEVAMELAKDLYLDYIREYGLKSWNSLAAYYKKANIQPEVTQVAEPETTYSETNEDDSMATVNDNSNENEPDVVMMEITPDNVGDLHNTLAGIFGEESVADLTTDAVESQVEESVEVSLDEVKDQDEEERVEYMLYQNDGEKVEWYGHFVNFRGLKVGENGMMVRMNNLGVGKGKVLATASMTMKEIGMFHKCYAAIRQSTLSDNKRVELFTKAFNNLQSAVSDPKFATLSTGKAISNFVLNYKKED